LTATTRPLPAGLKQEHWIAQAQCAQANPDVFFADRDTAAEQEAKQICCGCRVLERCLRAALAREGGASAAWRWGVWGGLNGTERRALYERHMKSLARARAAQQATT